MLGLGEGEADSVGDGDGDGVGEVLRFFFLEEGLGETSGEGLGLGEDFFFFGEGETLGSSFGMGVGLGVGFFFGEGDFSGDAVGFGVGDFVAVDFFFVLRGVGVGAGAKIFFSLLPNDSSARVLAAPPETSAITSKVQRIRMERERSTDGDDENRFRCCHPEPR